MRGGPWTRLSGGCACACPRHGLFESLADEDLHPRPWRGGVKSGRSRTLGCVGPNGGARVLDGLPGALLSWVWGGECGIYVFASRFLILEGNLEACGAETEERFSGFGWYKGTGRITPISRMSPHHHERHI